MKVRPYINDVAHNPIKDQAIDKNLQVTDSPSFEDVSATSNMLLTIAKRGLEIGLAET